MRTVFDVYHDDAGYRCAHLSVDDGVVEGRVAVLVGGVDAGAGRQQAVGGGGVAGGGGDVERCVALDVGGRGVGAPLQQVGDDAVQLRPTSALE